MISLEDVDFSVEEAKTVSGKLLAGMQPSPRNNENPLKQPNLVITDKNLVILA